MRGWAARIRGATPAARWPTSALIWPTASRPGWFREGYDSQYNYYNPGQWDFWGLFAVDDTNAVVKTYTPRKIFYTLSQVSKWVRPGAQMIGVSGSVSSLSPLLAFKHTARGQVTILGINTSGSDATLNGTLASLPTVSNLQPLLHDVDHEGPRAYGGNAVVSDGTFGATIPANCVFTLTGFTGVHVVAHQPGQRRAFQRARGDIVTGRCGHESATGTVLRWSDSITGRPSSAKPAPRRMSLPGAACRWGTMR